MWQPGTVIVQGQYRRHKLVIVRPVTVVEDSGPLLALCAPAGTAFRFGRWGVPTRQQLSLADRLSVYLSEEPPELQDGTVGSHVLTLNMAWPD